MYGKTDILRERGMAQKVWQISTPLIDGETSAVYSYHLKLILIKKLHMIEKG